MTSRPKFGRLPLRHFTLIAVLQCCVCSPVANAEDKIDTRAMQRNSLKGAKTVCVCGTIAGAGDIVGVSSSQMANIVSLELRKHGISLIDQSEFKSISDKSQAMAIVWLGISVTSSKEVDVGPGAKLTAWHARLVVYQFATTLRSPDDVVPVQTWESSPYIGALVRGYPESRDQVREILQTLTEQFANDYLTVNKPH